MIRIFPKNMAFGGDMNDFMLRISFHISFKSSRLKPITELLICVYYPNFHMTTTAHTSGCQDSLRTAYLSENKKGHQIIKFIILQRITIIQS